MWPIFNINLNILEQLNTTCQNDCPFNLLIVTVKTETTWEAGDVSYERKGVLPGSMLI